MSQLLLVYLSGDFSEADVGELEALASRLAAIGPWSLGPPEFVDETDDSSCNQPEDEPVRTVGVCLPVSAPGKSPGTPVEEATKFVDAMASFSRDRAIDLELQLGETYVGEIRAGVPDELVRDGLLGQW